jgi:hypothetical protein
MQATTWVDRITDEKNAWLSAVKMEERGDFGRAIVLYIDDATANLRSAKIAKAALSASCAGECLDALGFPGVALLVYREVAQMYYENARRKTGISIREMLWSLWQSAQFRVASGDERAAAETYREYEVASARIELFRAERGAGPSRDMHAWRRHPMRETPPAGDWSAVLSKVDGFLSLEWSGFAPSRTSSSGKDRKVKGGNLPLEKNFVNQLG